MLSFSEYEALGIEQLHYVYGADCYQHAIGYKPVIFYRNTAMFDPSDPQDTFITYVGLQPGSVCKRKLLEERDPKIFAQNVLAACLEEGLIDCEDNFRQEAGYRTLALFLREKERGDGNDHHYAVNVGGVWESKTARAPVIRSLRKEDLTPGYTFDRYLLAPENMLPMAIAEWAPKVVQVILPNGQFIELNEIDEQGLGHFGHTCALSPSQNCLFSLAARRALPLPPWPYVGYVHDAPGKLMTLDNKQ